MSTLRLLGKQIHDNVKFHVSYFTHLGQLIKPNKEELLPLGSKVLVSLQI